jgi:2-polyprenyl-3-methyl-5-hydroxy-6-metoxy-1,4-benzoquinol methylase
MSLEQVEACPVCGEKSFQPFLVCKDYTTSGESFHVEQCVHCKMTLTNPRPKENEAGKYYQSTSYISHTAAAAGLMDYIYLIVRGFTLKSKYKLIKPHLHNNLLLDVGCGTGHFLNYCSSNSVSAFGVEPSKAARDAAHNEHVFTSISEMPSKKFSVITLWHVLEHIYNLEGTICQLKSIMAENGTIFIAVPNLQSFDASKYQELWAAYDVPRHVWHFSKKDMITLIEKQGLKVKQIFPMKLDVFYVSLLSEKYSSNGKLSFVSIAKAIVTGIRSNIKARKETNYSSLIYLIQK